MRLALVSALILGLAACASPAPASSAANAATAIPSHAPVADAAPPAPSPTSQPAFDCANVPPVPATLPGARSFDYSVTPTRTLRLHVFAPEHATDAPRPAIMFFFGGGWRTGSVAVFADRARWMAREGYIAIVPDYRVACRDQTTAIDAAADAMSAYQWVRANAADLKIDPSRIVLSGGSAGGHIAAFAAMTAQAHEKPAALVLFNPAVDLVAVAGNLGLTPQAAATVSPSVLPAHGTPPAIMFHGDSDQLVAIQTVRDYCERLRASHTTCQLVEYPGRPHGFFQNRQNAADLGGSPYDDTMNRAIAFLKDLDIAP